MQSDEANNPVSGILWMLLSGLCFVGVTALVKFLGPRIPAVEAAFLRYVLGLVFLLPMLRQMLAAKITPRLHLLIGFRGLLHALGVGLWFYSMTRVPLAEVTAMNYLSPVYVTIGAALFLGERLAIRRIAAVVCALVGAAIILRPGMRELDFGHLTMLGTTLVFAGSFMVTKVLSSELSPAVIVGMLAVWVTIFLAPFAIAVWVPPTPQELVILFAVAAFATAGHYTMTLALRAAPITVTQPATFLQLVWATLLGAMVFGEPVDAWVVFGGSVIILSVSFITWREAVLKRKVTPAVSATKV